MKKVRSLIAGLALFLICSPAFAGISSTGNPPIWFNSPQTLYNALNGYCNDGNIATDIDNWIVYSVNHCDTMTPVAHQVWPALATDIQGLDTSVVPENGNLYFTNTRAVSALTGTLSNYLAITLAASTYLTQSNAASTYLTVSSAASTYATQSAVSTSLAGKFPVPTGTTSQYLRGDGTPATLNTSVVPEVTNLYYTSSRAVSAVMSAIFNGTSAQYVKGDGTLGTLPTAASWTDSSFSLSITGTGATGTQVSSTQNSTVNLTYSTQVTVTLGGSPASNVTLKKCATNSATESDWVDAGQTESSQPTTLSITVNGVYGNKGQITTDLPAGWYVKAESSGSGTHSEAFVSGRKTLK